jgi:hypothetical protein
VINHAGYAVCQNKGNEGNMSKEKTRGRKRRKKNKRKGRRKSRRQKRDHHWILQEEEDARCLKRNMKP